MRRIALAGMFLIISGICYGQGCAVCTKVAAGLDDKSARGLNGGIIYLALLPLVIMGTLGFIWWRSNNSQTRSS